MISAWSTQVGDNNHKQRNLGHVGHYLLLVTIHNVQEFKLVRTWEPSSDKHGFS